MLWWKSPQKALTHQYWLYLLSQTFQMGLWTYFYLKVGESSSLTSLTSLTTHCRILSNESQVLNFYLFSLQRWKWRPSFSSPSKLQTSAMSAANNLLCYETLFYQVSFVIEKWHFWFLKMIPTVIDLVFSLISKFLSDIQKYGKYSTLKFQD